MMRESLAALARSNATAATGNPRSRGRADHAVQVAGTTLLADPDGALYWTDEKLLVVADLHLEKGSAFARRGVLLPPYDTASTLSRLARLTGRKRNFWASPICTWRKARLLPGVAFCCRLTIPRQPCRGWRGWSSIMCRAL